MSVYDDKMNQEMLKVVCDLNRLIAEVAKVAGVTILNALTNKSMKDKLDIHGRFNNYDVLSVTGLSMDEAKALLKEKKKIIANGFYDRDGHYILAIKRSDFNKISELEKEIADGTLNVDDFLEEYRKNKSEQEHSLAGEQPSRMPNPIDVPFEEVPEDAPELTEEDFEQGGDFKVNFNPEEVARSIENEKVNEIENEVAAEETVDHNNDFASGERDELEAVESADTPQIEENIGESDISPEAPPVPKEDIEEPTVEDQNIDPSDEHAPEATEEPLKEDSDNVPSIHEKQAESDVCEKEDDLFERTTDDADNVVSEESKKVNSADIEEQRSAKVDNESEQRDIDANNESEHHEVEKSTDDHPNNSYSEEYKEDSGRLEEAYTEGGKSDSLRSEEYENDSMEQCIKSDESSSEKHNAEEIFDHSEPSESSATDRSGENASYRNDNATTHSNEDASNIQSIEASGSEQKANEPKQKVDKTEQPRSATQSAETEKRNDGYSNASDHSQNDRSSSEQKTSRSASLDERDRREKEEAIQKQIDRRERRENVTVTEVGTGASLFSSYNDSKDAEQLHAADRTNKPAFSDHREIKADLKDEISGSKTLQNGNSHKETLSYKEQSQNHYTLPSTDSAGDKTNVQFNRLTLINRYTGNVATDMVKSVGTVFEGSIEEGYRESEQGRGKAQMSGISTFVNNIGYSNLASVKRDALIRKTQREINSGTGAYRQLDQLLKTKGFAGINFSSRKNANTSMEDIYKMLQRSGLASNRDGVWDLTKFDRLYRQARKSGDYSNIARALGLSSISGAEMKLLAEQTHQIAKRDRIGRKGTEGKITTGKTFRSMIAHKLGQDSQVLAGYMNVKQTVQTVRSTAKAARLMAVTTGRVIGKLGKWAGRMIGFGANTRLLRDTTFGRGYRKIDSGVIRAGKKIDDLKEHHKDKKDKKETKKEDKKTSKKKKKETKKNLRRDKRQARFASLAKKWNRFAPGFLKTNSLIGRTIGHAGKFVGKLTKVLGSVFKKIASAIGFLDLLRFAAKKYIFCAIAGAFLILGAAVVVIAVPADFILGFEIEDDEDDTGDPIMNKTMHSLQEMETKWTDSLLNDTQGVDLTDYNLKYGSSYKTAAEYIPESGAPRIFWGQHNVKWNDISGFTANPFGNFDLENDNTASFMNNINGGVELAYKTKDGSARTSNIKEIICMADIYTMFSTEPEDTHDDGQAVDGSESANAKQSGATFAASNKKINGDLKSWASNSMIAYAQDLFNMSHQEIIDLQYVILPTKVTKDSFDPDTTVVDGENSTTVKVTQCPDYDFGGCQIYENFYYDKNGIAVKDKDGNLHTAGGVYPLKKDNMEFEEDDEGNIINYEQCYADSVDDFNSVYNENNSDCWEIEKISSHTDSPKDYSEPDESDFSDTIKSLAGDKEYVTGFSWNSDLQCFIFTTEIEGDSHEHSNPVLIIDEPGGKGKPAKTHIEYDSYTTTDVEYCTYHVTHECAGDHHGRYCGGHLKAKITGVIYGFTDTEVGAEEAGVTIAGKVEDGTFVHKDSNKFVLNDLNVFKKAQDIFDIDAACTHPNEREDWEGWTEENIELTLLKYNMDWEDLYGFDLTTTLGGQALTSADTQEIMKQIRENYPGLSEERLSVVERGLNYVGKIGYSQAHHNCPLEGPCLISKSGPCYLSDCSGFTSNLWLNKLGFIYTTETFRGRLNGNFDSSKNLPGDIIVHYDPNGNHALLYIGEFEYDGTYQTWSIDCSTVKGVGNVFLRHRDYYDSCSYISPAP